ncbi:MAG: peptidylprolyl isomerase [Acidobacteriota bacterium]|nr:MAG: peptidylprolyl isomerase [Acidobacteriota bacterium]
MILILLMLPLAMAAGDDAVLARIGQKSFTVADFNRWVTYNPEAGREAVQKDNKRKANMLNQIITGMVVADIARKESFDRRPDVREKTEHLVNNFLSLEYLDKVVAAEVKASDDDIRRYYEGNLDQFLEKEAVKASHILISVSRDASDADKAAARQTTAELLERIRGGESFEKLASVYSADPGSRGQGGSLGWFGHGRMVAECDEVVFSLKPGEISDIVETKFGYHIIRLDERREAAPKPLEAVRSTIEERVTRMQRVDAVDAFVKNAMKEAGAEIDLEVLVGSDPHFATQ